MSQLYGLSLMPSSYSYLYSFTFTSLIFGIPERNIFLEWFDTLFIMHLGTMLWIMVLMVFYVVHVVKNPVLKNEMKAIWAVVVFMGSVFALPVY